MHVTDYYLKEIAYENAYKKDHINELWRGYSTTKLEKINNKIFM